MRINLIFIFFGGVGGVFCFLAKRFGFLSLVYKVCVCINVTALLMHKSLHVWFSSDLHA